ncbi:hypothetical protein HDU96_009581 [Phlyctochytrium bullatum]|nr:hypothetical protein HDU96_009581 [Phlyctochytrium bullatum]
MSSLSQYHVLEFKTCKKVKDDEAMALLRRVASMVKPLMKKRSWTLPILREFYPSNPALLGLNINHGQEIRLRLRHPANEARFLDFESVLGTMLHELTHNAIGPHNAQFYKYLDDLSAELAVHRAEGWQGEGFDAPGRRVGERVSHNVSEAARRRATVLAAEKRAAAARTMGPPGGRVLGGAGNRVLIEPITGRRRTPAEMAALAAERRFADAVWCGNNEERGPTAHGGTPSKRPRQEGAGKTGEAPWVCPVCTCENPPTFLVCDACETERAVSAASPGAGREAERKLPAAVDSKGDVGQGFAKPDGDPVPVVVDLTEEKPAGRENVPVAGRWECQECGWTLNEDVAEKCEACLKEKPQPAAAKPRPVEKKTSPPSSRASVPPPPSRTTAPPPPKPAPTEWTCSTCTLENPVHVPRCLACDALRPVTVGPPDEVVVLEAEGVWICPQCMGETGVDFRMCSVCQFIRAM